MHNEKLCIAVVVAMLLTGCASENATKYYQSEGSSNNKISVNPEKTLNSVISEIHAKPRKTAY